MAQQLNYANSGNNSGNNRVTTTKHMSTIIASIASVHCTHVTTHMLLFLSGGVGKILL